MNSAPEVQSGVWEHTKTGQRYFVLGVARLDSEDDGVEELVVVYTRLYRRDGVPMTARLIESFLGTVVTADGAQPRFRYVGSEDESPS